MSHDLLAWALKAQGITPPAKLALIYFADNHVSAKDDEENQVHICYFQLQSLCDFVNCSPERAVDCILELLSVYLILNYINGQDALLEGPYSQITINKLR